MLTTVKGKYENGHIILEELRPSKKANVLVTFLEEAEDENFLKKRPFGTMAGTIKLSPDFNEPLEIIW